MLSTAMTDPNRREFDSSTNESKAGMNVSVTTDEKSNPNSTIAPSPRYSSVLALETGVTVIAVHIATTGKNEGEGNFERLLSLFGYYENLYTEISNLTQINKLGYLHDALKVAGLSERMLYGSDWPLQFFPLVSPWYQIGRVGIGDIREVSKLKNQWDRDVALKRAMGVPQDVFDRGRVLLNIR